MNVRHCWTNVNIQRRQLILCKVYRDALAYTHIVDEPAEAEHNLQDEPGDSLDDLRAYMSDDEGNCDTDRSVDLQNSRNDSTNVEVLTIQANAESNE